MKTAVILSSISLAIIAAFTAPVYASTTMYVTDNFEITMRNGKSIANNILRMLKSGQQVTVLEEDPESQYSLVEVDDGKTGYVLSRFLVDTRPAWEQLEVLKETVDYQNTELNTVRANFDSLKADFDLAISDNETLKKTLLASENELAVIRDAAENTLQTLDDNQQLETLVSTLSMQVERLSDENIALKDASKMDWFIRGAAVSLIAFLLGIMITRIRWRKADSWGS